MELLKKWLVGLDLTPMDDSVLKFTKLLSEILHPERIEFMHIVPQLSDAVNVHLSYSIPLPSYDDLLEQVEKKVFQYFSGKDPIACEVVEGMVQFDLWRESYQKEIDLFIAGSKAKHQGRGLLPRKFVRKSFCSVLFVPQQVPKALKKLWVPVEFSELCGMALEQALDLSSKVKPPAEVCVQHVYDMPHAYYYHGFPKDEIMQTVKEDVQNEFQKFNKKYNPKNIPLQPVFTVMKQPYAADHIQSEAERMHADLILMASGARSRFSKIILGSETEHLVQEEKQLPLLVLKKKKDQVKLWDLVNP